MNNAHTPAPWKITRSMQGENIDALLIDDTIGKHSICRIEWTNHFISKTDLANAQLIAAAPAMLEALERARDRLQLAMSTSPATGGETWLSDIDKIINQALGE